MTRASDQSAGAGPRRRGSSPGLPRVLHVAEVAAYLGVSEDTVRELIRRREIPGVKLGGRWMVRESSLAAVFEQREEERRGVEDHATRVLRGIRDERRGRRVVVPPRLPPCPPSSPSGSM